MPPLDLLLLVPTALIFGVALLVLARLRLVRRRRQLSRRAGPRASLGAGDELPLLEEEPGLTTALDEGSRSIGEGSPRNAIVATWVRLEQAVEGERFPHRPEETPSELVERALSSYHLDGDAIHRLAALYREARFSTHPVTEDHRLEAAECLRRLLATIGSARAMTAVWIALFLAVTAVALLRRLRQPHRRRRTGGPRKRRSTRARTAPTTSRSTTSSGWSRPTTRPPRTWWCAR